MRTFSFIVLAAALAGCGENATSPSGSTPSALAVISGGAQTGTAGSVLPTPLVVGVTASNGTAVAGVTVAFAVTSGSGSVAPSSSVTDAAGQASTQLTFGTTSGAVQVTATVAGTALAATLSFTATPPADAACTTTAPALGEVATPLFGSRLCVSGGTAGAEFALIPVNTSASALALASVSVQGTGIDLATTSLSIAASMGAQDLSPASSLGSVSSSVGVNESFHARLRASETSVLGPRISGARRRMRARQQTPGVALSVIPATPVVGQVLSLNANGDDACDVPVTRGGRIAAITSRAIVVADTGNPAGGFTDDEYRSIGITFDTLIDPLDRATFGDPTDIDGNGRIVLFFTRAVNALTPSNGNGSYVGGFFYARDLFPVAASSTFDACPTSNVGEMFYLIVPDPNGTINGNAYSKSQVTTIVRGLVAHEYQHLINAARRMYVNTAASDFEDVWLNEGLSHIAEELLFYRETGLTPRQNLDATALRRSSAYVAAFNADALSNFGRYAEFLASPASSSPYADNDKLATRGATWSFLRYAADRAGTTDGTIWQRLVNSTTTGRSNLQQVFGSDLSSLFRDWSASILADDLTGAAASYQQPSWNFRSIFAALQNSTGYPLGTVSLTAGTPAMVSLAGGGAAFLRFGVGAGKTGTLDWGTIPANVQLTLVRTR